LVPDLLAGLTPRRLHEAAIAAFTPRPAPRIDLQHVAPIRASVADAVAELVDELPRAGRVTFARLTAGLVERLDVIVRFLAVLELFKQGLVELDQADRFGDILVEWRAGDPRALDPATIAADLYEG
jgi:segregation and condensation protein A